MADVTGVIDDILRREGGATFTNDPKDGGGRTQYGIAERSNPRAWADGKVTEQEARDIYISKYVVSPGFNKITDPKLQAQLIDFGVNSGPMIAIQKLQGILGVTADGRIGQETLTALDKVIAAGYGVQVNNQLVASRIKMLCRIVVQNPSQIKYLVGWINRSCEFL